MNTSQIISAVLGGLILIVALMWALPQYNVWSEGLGGQAEFARAEQNRQIRIEASKAKREAAVFEAQAEVIRAQGVADANKIIADGLGGPQGYLRWRFITMLEETGGAGRETIYIPTEAGMPILEATRLLP